MQSMLAGADGLHRYLHEPKLFQVLELVGDLADEIVRAKASQTITGELCSQHVSASRDPSTGWHHRRQAEWHR